MKLLQEKNSCYELSRTKLIVAFVGTFLSIVLSILPDNVVTFVFSFCAIFIVGSFVNPRSSIHMMYFLGYCTFIYVPALLHWLHSGLSLDLLLITSICSCFFLFLTRRTSFIENVERKDFSVLLFYTLVVAFIALLALGLGDLLRNLFPFFILVMALSFKQNRITNNFFKMLLFTLIFMWYALFVWSGFGRLVVMGWLILAILTFMYSLSFYINRYFFAIPPAILSVLLADRDLLNLNFKGLESALSGSAFGPYKLASSFIDRFEEQGVDVIGFVDQVVFTLFVYIPREYWSEKPYGFGFEYVVRHMDYYLIDAGHSIASTLIGDHMYYLGYTGIITGLFMLFCVAKITNFLYRLKNLNGNGIILFSASMMALVWGGMTSFSARIVLPAMIFTLLYLALSRVISRQFKF